MSRVTTRSIGSKNKNSKIDTAGSKCGESKCTREVKNRGIGCDACKSWFHTKCGKITSKAYKLYTEHTILKWICPLCIDAISHVRVSNMKVTSSPNPSDNSLNLSHYYDVSNEDHKASKESFEHTLIHSVRNINLVADTSQQLAGWKTVNRLNKHKPPMGPAREKPKAKIGHRNAKSSRGVKPPVLGFPVLDAEIIKSAQAMCETLNTLKATVSEQDSAIKLLQSDKCAFAKKLSKLEH